VKEKWCKSWKKENLRPPLSILYILDSWISWGCVVYKGSWETNENVEKIVGTCVKLSSPK